MLTIRSNLKLNNTILKIKKNHFLTYGKRRARNYKIFEDSQGYIDDFTYYKNLKKFNEETRGLPKNSQKWWELKNKYISEMNKNYLNEKTPNKESGLQQYLRFMFVIIPEDSSSYELISILNYYQIRYKAIEDTPVSKNILGQILGYEYRNIYKQYKYPFLLFESSEEKSLHIDSYDEIIKFLVENKFINDFRTQSSYEKDGLEFVKKMKDQVELAFKKISNKFTFYFRVTNFTEAFYSYSPFTSGSHYRSRILSRLYRLFISWGKDIIFNMSHKAEIKNSYFEIVKLSKEWVERLNNKPFHGGDVPDAADFRLYSLVRMYSYCRKVKIVFHKYTDSKFHDWIDKMSLLCHKSPFINIKEVSYNYNPDMEEKVQMEEKINKNDTKAKNDVVGAFGNRKRKIFNI